MKIGLKLWSTNDFYSDYAEKLFCQGDIDYIELFIVPGSSKKYLSLWKQLNIPIILHGPHSYFGINFSVPCDGRKKLLIIKEVESFFDALTPEFIIFHPGISGTIEETIRQLSFYRKSFSSLFSKVLVENKPPAGLKGEKCVGSSPSEIRKIMDEVGLGFCLDFGHACCSAFSEGLNYKDIVNEFLKCEPAMFHLSDGIKGVARDQHLNLGNGTYDLNWFLQRAGMDAVITIETQKNSKNDLDDFKMDIKYLKNCLRG
jgi:endonuclease IV